MAPSLSAIAILVALLLPAVLALSDVECVMFSADCDSCTKNGCSWCSDGYCVAPTSDICEKNKLLPTCSAQPAPPIRASRDACSSLNCAACLVTVGCIACGDSSGGSICTSGQSCPDPYSPSFDTVVSQCPTVSPTPGSNSPIIYFYLVQSQFVTNGVINVAAIQAYVINFLNFYLGLAGNNALSSQLVIILEVLLANGFDITFKRDALDPADTLKVTIAFADLDNSFTAQQLGATFLEAGDTKGLPPVNGVNVGFPALAPNSPPIEVLSLTPSTGAGSVVGTHGGSSSDNAGISKGALAGIIIGVFFGAVIIVAILFFLAVRRRDSYPMAFRSPAAAYRP